MKHETMENLMLVNINDKLWSMQEREEIIKDAVDKYLEKRRFKRTSVPPENISRLDENKAGPSGSGAVIEIIC